MLIKKRKVTGITIFVFLSTQTEKSIIMFSVLILINQTVRCSGIIMGDDGDYRSPPSLFFFLIFNTLTNAWYTIIKL